MVLGAAELVWLDQQQKHWELGFHLRGRPVRSCISWKRYVDDVDDVDDVVVGSRVFCCSCIFVILRACYLVPISLVSGAGTKIHTWVDVELRVVGQYVAVNVENPNLSWVNGRGPQQKSTLFPWTGVLKGGLGCIRGVVLGLLARTKMLGLRERFGVARLLEDIVELVYMGYLLSVIRGLVHSLPCSRVAQIGRKTVQTWIFLHKNRMVDDKKDLRPKPRNGEQWCSSGTVWWPWRLWVAESWPRLHEEEQFSFIVVLQPFSEETAGETAEDQGSAENCWRSNVCKNSSGKRRQRRRRGQWNCRRKQRCWPRL